MKEKFKKCCEKIPIQISITSRKLAFIFIFPAFGVAHNKFKDKYLKIYFEYFNILIYYISYFFSFIPLIIYTINNRAKKSENINNNEDPNSTNSSIYKLEEEPNKDIVDLEDKKRKKIFIIKSIIILAVLCGISLAYNHFNYESFVEKKTIGLAYKIPEFFLLSFLILRYKYHKHHYITLGFNTIALIAKYILTIIQSEAEEYIPTHLWKYFLFSITYCLFLIIGKYFMENYNQTPYLIMFIISIVMGIILVTIGTIKYFIDSDSSHIFNGFKINIISKETLLYFFGDITTQFLFNLGLWITVYYFTPCHTIISENMMEIMYYIYDYGGNRDYWLEKNFYWNFWLMPTILVINLLCSLIFNEIIILKFCSLDYYTKIRIIEREKKESGTIVNMLDNSFGTDNSKNMSISSDSDSDSDDDTN